MAFRTRTRETAQVAFREIGNSGVSIAFTNANHKDSMSLLQQNGLRAMTYQEAPVRLSKDKNSKEQLKGNWFWLAGEGTELSGYYIFNNKGELTKGKGHIENTVYVWKGSQPLSLSVRSDDDARIYEGRYYLYAYDSPDDVATVVVGVRDAHEVGAPQKADVTSTARSELLKGARNELTALSENGISPEKVTFLTRLARGE